MAYTVTIDDQPYFVDAGSLTIDKTIGKASSAAFTLHTTDTDTHFQQYQKVKIYDDTQTLRFSGYLSPPLKEQKPGFQTSLEHTLTCIDQHWLAQKRRVAASYTNQTCGFIAQDIVNNVLLQEGVTIGQIYDGPTPSDVLYPSDTLYPGGNVGLVPSALFVYSSASDAFDALVKQASDSGNPYYWSIDEQKQFWFVPYATVIRPTIVDGTAIDMGQGSGSAPYVQRQNPTYRNVQYLLGGVAQTLPQTEQRVGDGNATAWTMGYDLASVPTISVNLGNGSGGYTSWVPKTVGVRGSSGFDFYWAQGDSIVTQDSSGTVLRGTPYYDLLKVAYTGQYPTVIYAPNGAQISFQQSLDGSSGLVEDASTDATIISETDGLSRASALLSRYGVQGIVLVFATLDPSFDPGQLITVNLPMHALNMAQMLVESVHAADSDGYNIWYTVTAITGPYDTTWSDFYGTLIKAANTNTSLSVGVSSSLALLKDFTVQVQPQVSLQVSLFHSLYPSTTLYPSNTLYPS